MWFQSHELPPASLASALQALGVSLRSAEDVYPGTASSLLRGTAFPLKPLALLFSRFEEVLFLDADNVALRDPSQLFDWPPYRQAGLLLWPDYWAPSTAPDALRVAPEAAAALAAARNSSDESGQLLANQRIAWRPLLMALFVNLQAPLYYRLLGSYMGAGDKDTWRFAAGMAGLEPLSVARPPGSAGVRGRKRPQVLLSNTMVCPQRSMLNCLAMCAGQC